MEKNIEKTVRDILGHPGRMISGSKSGYRRMFPENLVVFNANLIIITEDSASKVWYGDIDITLDRELLKRAAQELDSLVYVLYEMDARFENEDVPVIGRYVYMVSPDGSESLGDSTEKYYDMDGDGIRQKVTIEK